MTAGCEATPLPEAAVCISDGEGSTARRDPAAGHGFAEAGVSQVAAPFLPPASSGLLLPSSLALYPTAAASSQCSSFVQLVFVQCCSWKCLWQLWCVGRGASLVHPLLLCSPGSTSVPCFSPGACSLPAARPPHGDAPEQPRGVSCPTRTRGASGSPGTKQTWPSTSVTAGGSGSTAATRFAA